MLIEKILCGFLLCKGSFLWGGGILVLKVGGFLDCTLFLFFRLSTQLSCSLSNSYSLQSSLEGRGDWGQKSVEKVLKIAIFVI